LLKGVLLPSALTDRANGSRVLAAVPIDADHAVVGSHAAPALSTPTAAIVVTVAMAAYVAGYAAGGGHKPL
jgi:hypothetical protein